MLQELSTWKGGSDLSSILKCVNIRACKIWLKEPEVEEKGMADILLFVLGRQSIRPETSNTNSEKQNWLFGLKSINWETMLAAEKVIHMVKILRHNLSN